jgi:hypothetical protein
MNRQMSNGRKGVDSQAQVGGSGWSSLRGRRGRCPFLALWVQQRPAKRGKARQRAKVKNRQILRGLTQGPAQISKGRQSAANGIFSAC